MSFFNIKFLNTRSLDLSNKHEITEPAVFVSAKAYKLNFFIET